MIKKIFFILSIAFSQTILAQENFASWRHISSHNSGATKDYVFSFRNTAIPAKTEFALYDVQSNKIMCCIKTDSKSLNAADLEKKYHIPNVWISDMTSEIYTEPHIENRPVYLAELTKGLTVRQLKDYYDRTQSSGGLAIPADAKLGSKRGEIIFQKAKFLVQYKTDSFGDEQDGGYDLFTIYKVVNGKFEKTPTTVQVNFTTY
jgi:hypothetical protein